MSDTADSTATEQEQATDTEVDESTETEQESEQEAPSFDADKAREKIRKLNSESKNLRERAVKAEQQAKENADNGERLTALEAENLRLRIGVKHGLPESLVKRLSGSTEEELLQDAEELMELFKGKTVPTNQPKERLRGGGDPTAEADPTADLDKFAAEAFRR
ncbi:hypothetical protein [Curtobacterium sp. SORGH_AS_0776]|uniref:hypothetical protein n=1 Tax=Curtobacterium sp. SORGH_AS_0776 TaxID=3041798 RepID=UPI00286789D4|nr:hypothetical protein [Curtobacterium sp. SORGH_AS_0776]MDR6172643.1 signal recognition particle GTPase [Curtobacterium sp. SORGH_AS_0776]